MRPVENERKYRIGIVINTTFKPARDVHLGIVNYLLSGGIGTPLLFVAGNGTSPANIKAFAEQVGDRIFFGHVSPLRFRRITNVHQAVKYNGIAKTLGTDSLFYLELRA